MATDSESLLLRLEASSTRLERQLSRANQVVARSAKGMENSFKAANDSVTRGMGGASSAMARFGQISGQQRFILQNTANQFGDLAVQISGGTSALRAFGQQAPQVLGAFGPVGAILGTIAAVGVPVAAAFLAAGDGAADFGDASDTLSKSLRDFESAAAIAESSLDDIKEKYGEVTGSVITLIEAMQRLARDAAVKDLRDALSSIDEAFLNINRLSSDPNVYLSQITAGALELSEAMQISLEDAMQLQGALVSLGEDRSLQEQADTLADIRAQLEGQRDEYGELKPAAAELYSQVVQLEDAARRVTATVATMETGMAGVRREAEGVAAALKLQASGFTGSGRGADPREFLLPGDSFGKPQDLSPPERKPISIGSAPRGTSGPTAAEKALKEENDLRRTAKQIIESQYTAEERRAAQLEEMLETRRKLVQAVGEDNALIGQLDTAIDRFQKMEEIGRQIAQTVASGLAQAVASAEDLGDAFKGILRQLAGTALQNVLTAALTGQPITGAAIFGGARATGGPVTGGMAYLTGERGPEMFVPSQNGTVLNAAQTAAAMTPSINVAFNVEGTTDAAGLRDVISRVFVPEMERIARGVQNDRMRRR